jgi:hypothetical protein
VKPGSIAADRAPKNNLSDSLSITWNHVIDKESLKINTLEQVLIEKVKLLFRDML